jgi:hypothetical protein
MPSTWSQDVWPNSEELTTISEMLDNIPPVGLFANGEIGRNRPSSRTAVLTVLAR